MSGGGKAATGAADVVGFWRAAGRRRWFRRDAGFDEEVRRVLGPASRRAAAGELTAWGDTAQGALALMILLDQAPRNIHRGTAQAFAADPLAREAADAALAKGLDRKLALELQPFVYLPFGHHEAAASQARSVRLFADYVRRGGEEGYLRSARWRAGVIARFGRFPHRNAALGRASTEAEEADLAERGA